jgi:glycerophosphoryl diester phosphodiesterase
MRLLHLVARRGNSFDFPENTLPALRSALALGARFIEIDVHLASDGTPILVRDQELARDNRAALTMTAAEIEQIDASEPARFGNRFHGTRIPSLATALGLLEGRPEITVFVMMGRTSVLRFGQEQVVTRVARALKPLRSRCILGSTDLPTVHAARSLAGYPIAWILSGYDNHTRLKYEALQPEYVFCDRAHLAGSGQLWRGPWRWAISEVDSLDDAVSLAERGADFVVSRHVRSLGEAMLSHSAATTQSRLEAILKGADRDPTP